MAIVVTCSACQKNLKVKDEHAGKRVKCPGCGAMTIVSEPAAAPVQAAPPMDPPDDDNGAPATQRRKKKRRRHYEDVPERRGMKPLFSMGGVEVTLPVLLTILFLVAALGMGAFFLLRAVVPSKLDVQPVDAYVAITGVRYTDVGERALGMNDVSYTIPGNRKIVVTRKNPNGEFLLMKINVSDKVLNDNLPRMAGATYLTPGHIKVKGGGETYEPLFASYADDTRGAGYQLGFNPGSADKGPAPSLESFLGPKGQWASWTHDGETTSEGESILFEGKSGMKVAVEISGEKLDKNRDGDPFETLGLKKKGQKGLGGLQLGEGASKYVFVRWDKSSDGFLMDSQAERPNDISISWTITCVCKRPKNAKEITLQVFGKEQVVKLP